MICGQILIKTRVPILGFKKCPPQGKTQFTWPKQEELSAPNIMQICLRYVCLVHKLRQKGIYLFGNTVFDNLTAVISSAVKTFGVTFVSGVLQRTKGHESPLHNIIKNCVLPNLQYRHSATTLCKKMPGVSTLGTSLLCIKINKIHKRRV